MGRYRRAGRGGGGVFSGIILITIGTLFLLNRAGYVDTSTMWRYWPFVLIALGLIRLIPPTNPERIGGSVMFVLMGVAFLLATWRIGVFTFANVWPLILVAVGAGIVTRALVTNLGGGRSDDSGSSATVIEEDRHD